VKSTTGNRQLKFETLEQRLVFTRLIPGDANGDFVFDQRDVLQVLEYGQYNREQTATWEEGDWNGDGRFDRLDLIVAIQSDHYQARTGGHSVASGGHCHRSSGEMHHAHPGSSHLSAELSRLAQQLDITHTAIASGRWSDAGSWEHGRLPGEGARVVIPAGVSITVDGVIDSQIEAILLKGSLEFQPDTDTSLTVETLLGMAGSRLMMGSTSDPIDSPVWAELNLTGSGPLDRTWDPTAISRGFITEGCVSIHGAQKTAWIELAEVPRAGDRTLQLDRVPFGWRVGDRLAIPGVDPNVLDDEVRTIWAVDGATIHLDRPLEHERPLPRDDMGLRLHVANLTRNAIIQSPSNAGLQDRGHVMFMHTLSVDIEYAGFYGLGRTNKDEPLDNAVVDSLGQLVPGTGDNPRGRYALHFHRGGTSRQQHPAAVHGSVVVGSPGWGLVNHSSFVHFTNNVAFDVDGAAFVAEAGDEMGSLIGNIAIHSEGSGGVNTDREPEEDFGHEGDGFWLQGAGVRVTDNVSAGQSGYGFAYYTRGLLAPELGMRVSFPADNLSDRSLAQGADRVPVGGVPIEHFRRNVAYGNWLGLEIIYHLEQQFHDQRSRIEDFTAWNNVTALNIPYTRQTDFRNLTLLSAIQPPTGFGVRTSRRTGDIVFEDVFIDGFAYGLRAPPSGDNLIRNGNFNNVQNILVGSATQPGRSLRVTGEIEFGTFLSDPPDPRQHLDVLLQVHLWTNQKHLEPVFAADHIEFDFGPFDRQRVYLPEQLPDAVPFPREHFLVPDEYVGLTSQELWDTYDVAIGGVLAPEEGLRVPDIDGVIARLGDSDDL
jgi:hypothetical protein